MAYLQYYLFVIMLQKYLSSYINYTTENPTCVDIINYCLKTTKKEQLFGFFIKCEDNTPFFKKKFYKKRVSFIFIFCFFITLCQVNLGYIGYWVTLQCKGTARLGPTALETLHGLGIGKELFSI